LIVYRSLVFTTRLQFLIFMKNLVPVSPPSVTTAQRNAIPAALRPVGAMVYNTDTGQRERWTGTAWQFDDADSTARMLRERSVIGL
jgi:hypothetical protein